MNCSFLCSLIGSTTIRAYSFRSMYLKWCVPEGKQGKNANKIVTLVMTLLKKMTKKKTKKKLIKRVTKIRMTKTKKT